MTDAQVSPPIRIHAIQTGTVRIKERQRSGKGVGVFRFLNTLRDRRWTEPLPILAWAIEHPEGVILVDTGETAAACEPGYFPAWHPFYRWGVSFQVRPDQEIGPRLEAVGIHPRDVRTVVLTHLHSDHTGGLRYFPESEIVVSEAEARAAEGFSGRILGYLPHRWPKRFNPTRIRFRPEPFGPFPESLPLTADGRVRAVPTPGHTEGHLSVVVEDGGNVYFLAGDASYSQALMQTGRVDGLAPMGGGTRAARTTLERIRTLAEEVELIYLPCHDPDSPKRLTVARGLSPDPGG